MTDWTRIPPTESGWYWRAVCLWTKEWTLTIHHISVYSGGTWIIHHLHGGRTDYEREPMPARYNVWWMPCIVPELPALSEAERTDLERRLAREE